METNAIYAAKYATKAQRAYATSFSFGAREYPSCFSEVPRCFKKNISKPILTDAVSTMNKNWPIVSSLSQSRTCFCPPPPRLANTYARKPPMICPAKKINSVTLTDSSGEYGNLPSSSLRRRAKARMPYRARSNIGVNKLNFITTSIE